jgi:hypothetical protein
VLDPNTNDVGLILLSRTLQGYGGTSGEHFVPVYVYDDARYLNRSVWFSGYGASCCGCSPDGAGTLRIGHSRVQSADNARIELVNDSANQLPGKGDSGGPAWSDDGRESFPPAAFGVDSGTGSCGNNATLVSPAKYSFWVRRQIANWKSPKTENFDVSSIVTSFWNRDDPDNSPSTATWSVHDGRLYEPSNSYGRILVNGTWQQNYPDGAIYYPRTEVQESADVSVNVQSPDNDGAGIVFRYVDDKHYYLFTVRQESGLAHFYKRTPTGYTTLGSAAATVNWAATGGVKLMVRAIDYYFDGFINGTNVLRVTDKEYPVGRVGIHKYGLTNASFDSFSITPRAPAVTTEWPFP